jgi:hypothetical protein
VDDMGFLAGETGVEEETLLAETGGCSKVESGAKGTLGGWGVGGILGLTIWGCASMGGGATEVTWGCGAGLTFGFTTRSATVVLATGVGQLGVTPVRMVSGEGRWRKLGGGDGNLSRVSLPWVNKNPALSLMKFCGMPGYAIMRETRP